MKDAFQDAIELLSNVTDAFTAALFLFDDDRRELTVAAHHTLSKKFDPNFTPYPGEGLVGWVAKSGQPLNVPRFNRDTGSLGFYLEDEDIKSFLAVPVGQAGVLCVDSKQTYVFTDKDQKILADFAQVILHLLKAEQVRRREKDYAAMLRLFHEIDRLGQQSGSEEQFLETALKVLARFARADSAFITSLEKGRSRYKVEAAVGFSGPDMTGKSFPADSGLVGWVFREGKSLVLKKVRSRDERSYVFAPGDPIRGFKAFLGLPIAVWGSNIGVAGLTASKFRDWSADEIYILKVISRWVITALMAWRNAGGT